MQFVCYFVIFCLYFFPVSASYAENAKSTYSLTIYSSAAPGAISPDSYRPAPGSSYAYQNARAIPGYAIIRQMQPLTLDKKENDITFSDVAAYIDPTTVMFTSLTHPETTHVIEQNYLFDLVSTAKLLERYIGKKITVEQIVGDSISSYDGTLMSTQGSIVLKDNDNKLLTLNNYSNLRFPELPGGLMTKPTLLWHIQTDDPGTHQTRVSYQTDGITWWSDYNVQFQEGKDANSGVLDLSAWVSIINQSGASYNDATLKLMAGDVQRAAQPVYYRKSAMLAMDGEMAAAPGFAEKSFFEYHLYTLNHPATLPDNSTKQLELFPTAYSIPAEKELIYNGQQDTKVAVYLKFKNDKKYGLGVPLPAGRIRVSKRDEADGNLEFIGEDVIQHTPKDEEIKIKLGNAFDVVGERKQTNYYTDNTRKYAEETVEISLRNHKHEAVKVIAEEPLQRYANWTITDTSKSYDKKDAYTVHFPVTLKPDGEEKIRYTVRYTW